MSVELKRETVCKYISEMVKLLENGCYQQEILKSAVELLSAESIQWIPVRERLPEEPDVYIVTNSKGDVVRFVFDDTESSREYWLRCVKAWMLIEPYEEDGAE